MLQQSIMTNLQKLKTQEQSLLQTLNDCELSSIPCKQATFLPTKTRAILRGHSKSISRCAWFGDGAQNLCSISNDAFMIIWNAQEKTKVSAIKLANNWMMALAVEQTGSMIACGGLDNVVTLYTYKENQLKCNAQQLLGATGYISSCPFVGNSHMLVGSGDMCIRLFDIATGKQLQCYSGHYGDVLAVAPSADCKTFLTASTDATIGLWDLRFPNQVASFADFESNVNCVKWFHLSEHVFAGACDDCTCRLYDVRYPRELQCYTDNTIYSSAIGMDFTSSGRGIFVAYEEGHVYLYNALNGTQLEKCKLDVDGMINDMHMSPNRSKLALATSAYTIQLLAP